MFVLNMADFLTWHLTQVLARQRPAHGFVRYFRDRKLAECKASN